MSRAQFPANRSRPPTQKSDFVVRKAIESDLERLAEIHAACYPDGRTTSTRLARFTHNPLGTLDAARTVSVGGRIVGHAFLFDTKTSFGGRLVPSVGIATVGIAPEERGRGYATGLLHALHEEARDRGACISVLHAFRHAFYGRVGYIATSPMVRARISPRALPTSGNSSARAARRGDRKTIERLYSEALSFNTGWIARSRAYWDYLFSNERFHFSLVQEGGVARGYAVWSLSQTEPHARTTLHVRECIGETSRTQRELFSIFARMGDQVDAVEIDLPIDSPWIHSFGDGAHPIAGTETLEHPIGDLAGGAMVRILDIGKALSLRGYSAPGALAIHIEDRGETWSLSSRREAKKTHQRPDLRITESALTSVLFGAQPLAHSIWLGHAKCSSIKARAHAESMLQIPGYHSIDPF